MARSKSGTSIAIAVLVVVVVAAGLWLILRPTPVEHGILFVGDSVTYMSAKELDAQVGAANPVVIARIGYRSTDLLPLFRRYIGDRERRDRPLKQVALLVGYNDVLKSQVESPALRDMMDLADRFECAIWLTLPPVPMHEDETERWNDRVRATARSHRHIHVVDDWRQAVIDAPPGKLITKRDGVHPTEAGGDELSKTYVAAVHREC